MMHVRREDDQIAVAGRGVGSESEITKEAKADARLGLCRVRERMTFLGGKFYVDSTAGDGAMAVLAAPLPHVTGDIAVAHGQEKAT